MVLLEEAPTTVDKQPGETHANDGTPTVDADARLATLQRDLRGKEAYLQATREELETSNEELRSANEEMQSVNEELETSKEELQSVNEELATANAELQSKVSDLSSANNDMSNLLAGTGVGTLFLDDALRVVRFTPTIVDVINLRATDVGRPVSDIATNLAEYDTLLEDARAVLDTLLPTEAEVRTKLGTWHLMRIRPYRTLQNVIEGVVVTFVDISGRKLAEHALEGTRELAESILATMREPFLVLSPEMRVIKANDAFFREFSTTPQDTIGRRLFDLGQREW